MHSDPKDMLAAADAADLEQRQAQRIYGPEWAKALEEMAPLFNQHLNAIVEELFCRLSSVPTSGVLIRSLAEPEQAQLKGRLRQHLLLLTSPTLQTEQHRAAAHGIARQHARMGVSRDDLAFHAEIMHAVVRDHIDVVAHSKAISALGQRVMRDTSLQLQIYQQIHGVRHRLTQDLTRIAWRTESYADFIDQVSQRLSQHEEIAASSFGRLDDQGVFRFEAVSGHADEFLRQLEQRTKAISGSGGSIHLVSEGPTGRAWRSRQVERCINFATDPRAEMYKDLMLARGYRSSVAIPVGSLSEVDDKPPSFVLTLYSNLPGAFNSPHQRSFIDQIQAILSFAINSIEARQGRADVLSLAVRQHLLDLLRSDDARQGGLEMHYQPLLDLHTGKVYKVEALARLREGDKLLGPGDFFSVLTPDNFVELYERGLRQVLRQRQIWEAQGLELDISLNLPSSALADPRYLDITRRALRELDCPSYALTLELLETESIGQGEEVARAFEAFRALGVQLAEDDLGAGHSGLSRLREMPFDLIKIDRSIIQNMERDAFDVLRFVYQLTRLGHALGKRVAIEGVENVALLEAARLLGVDTVQGYVIAKPMSSAALGHWLMAYRVPSLADNAPDGGLVRMARLLLWEERLHLRLEHSHTLNLPEGDDIALCASFEPPAQMAALTVVRMARRYGMFSPAYQDARQGLILAINT